MYDKIQDKALQPQKLIYNQNENCTLMKSTQCNEGRMIQVGQLLNKIYYFNHVLEVRVKSHEVISE